MRRTHRAGAIVELEGALPARARQHDDRIVHPHRKMRALSGFARKILEDRRRQAHHFHFVEGARRQGKQRPADPISLGIRHLAHIAERRQSLDQMECRRIVQPDTLGKIGQADAVPVAGDLLHDGEGARERLHAAARLAGAARR